MIIETISVGPLDVNCYLLACEKTHQGMVIDPGDQEDKILGRIQALAVDVQYIVLTHAHIDHIAATMDLQQQVNGRVCCHSDDRFLLNNASAQAELFQLRQPKAISIDIDLKQTSVLHMGACSFSVLETPGHSPGSVCLYAASNQSCFVGDTLFRESIGRTDLPGGDSESILFSIRNKLFTLPEETAIYPGHGPATDINHEQNSNPYF